MAGCAGPRRKIWDIPGHYHCSLIGTCLDLAETQSLLAKSGYDLPRDAPDYDVHGTAVRLAEENNRFSKAVHRFLDRRHKTTITRCAKAANADALEELWGRAVESGDVVGPYWALMTSPLITIDLARRAFGEIHMLSHLAGASARVDLKRLKSLEESLRETRSESRDLLERCRSRSRRRESRAQELRQQLDRTTRELARLRGVEKRLREIEAGDEIRHLRATVERSQAECRALAARNGRLQARVDELESDLVASHQRGVRVEEDLAAKSSECETMESYLLSALGSDPTGECGRECDDGLPCPALRGAVVLCVGGRASLLRHYRALVERGGGDFLHHDGGKEHCVRRLPALLGQADVVVCPVDAVGHTACRLAKTTCKRLAKPIMLMRQSGLSSFLQALHDGVASGPSEESPPTVN